MPREPSFPAGSIGAVVFGTDAPAPRPHPGPLQTGSLAAAVLEPLRGVSPLRLVCAALVVSAGLHAGVAGVMPSHPQPEEEAPPPAPPMELSGFVETRPAPPPPMPEAPPPAAEAPAEAAPKAPASRPARVPRPAAPPAPVRAGQAVSRDASSAPADFTLAQGDQPIYGGGASSSQGTNPNAVHGPTDPHGADEPSTVPSARPSTAPSGSRARPVRPASNDWSDCAWPRAASNLGIEDQDVLVRVVTDERGAPLSVTVLADPGHGFGAEAKRCALAKRFLPALDEDGVPYASTSKPIRVQFER